MCSMNTDSNLPMAQLKLYDSFIFIFCLIYGFSDHIETYKNFACQHFWCKRLTLVQYPEATRFKTSFESDKS